MLSTQTRRFRIEEVSEAVSRTAIKLATAEGESKQHGDRVRLHVKDVLVSLPIAGQQKAAF